MHCILNKYTYGARCLLGYLQAAYRNWLCAITIPYYDNVGGVVRPCAYYAELVENRCPYMSPHGEHQYAGEPLFLASRQYLLLRSYPRDAMPAQIL